MTEPPKAHSERRPVLFVAFLRSWLRWNARRQLERAVHLYRVVTKFVLNLIGAVTFLAIVALVYDVVNERSISIEPILVPKQLQDSGYTPDVAATRLRDSLERFAEDANTRSKGPTLALRREMPEFVLPAVGVPFETVAAYIRKFFLLTGRQILSGEMTIADNHLMLRLRKNGTVFYTSSDGINPNHPDSLLEKAVPKVFAVTDPYFYAVGRSRDHPMDALEIANRIIADWPESDHNVRWAYNLVGTILHRKRRFTDAIAKYEKAIKLDLRFPSASKSLRATAYSNWGVALRQQGRFDHAIAQFRKAIKLEPDFAGVHKNLGDALRDKGDIDEANCEYRRAITELQKAVVANPFGANAHYSLGKALKAHQGAGTNRCGYVWPVGTPRQVKIDDAVAEYRLAIALNPHHAPTHYELGMALREKGHIDNAILEFQMAIEFNDLFADAYTALGNALRARGKIDEAKNYYGSAIAIYQDEIQLDPRDPTAHMSLGDVLSEAGEHRDAITHYTAAINIDLNYAAAYNNRCYEEGVRGRERHELQQALVDCNTALRRFPNDAEMLDSRGLIYLKLCDFAKSIADYDAAIKLRPDFAESLYGRGVAKKGNGDSEGGDADIKAAKNINGAVGEDFARLEVK